jgi:hypothetical protein
MLRNCRGSLLFWIGERSCLGDASSEDIEKLLASQRYFQADVPQKDDLAVWHDIFGLTTASIPHAGIVENANPLLIKSFIFYDQSMGIGEDEILSPDQTIGRFGYFPGDFELRYYRKIR